MSGSYPFLLSHGLSYTTFEVSDLHIKEGLDGQEFLLQISMKVRNVGSRVGSEVIQLYIELPENGTTTPSLQLKGFKKVHNVAVGSSATVELSLDKYAISFWDEPNESWCAIGTSTVGSLRRR